MSASFKIKMKELTVVLLVTLVVAWGENTFDDDYPKIEELFPMITGTSTNAKSISNVKKIEMDIEKLDMSKFRRKLMTYNSKIIMNGVKINNTRRQTLYFANNTPEWYNASDVLLRSKVIDLMLQILYMGRYKVKSMEDDVNFNPKETGYRIAFIHRRLQKLLQRMMDIYTIMIKNKEYRTNVAEKWLYIYPAVILHHKAVRLHVDYIYLWWVMVRIDAAYQMKMQENKGYEDIPDWKKNMGR